MKRTPGDAPPKAGSEPAPSGRRPLAETSTPEPWILTLLDLACELPVDEELRMVVKAGVDRAAPLLPGAAIGACVVDPGGLPIVEVHLPSGSDADPGRDPTRLFPHFAHELVLPLDTEVSGSTLHLASDDAARFAAGSEAQQIAHLTARVLASLIKRAISFQRARQSSNELHRLQAQVIQAEKLASLGQIVAGVVHELNNPLTSIVAYSDYLRKRTLEREGDAEDVERLRRIGEAAERILKFSRDLVAYARPSSDIPAPVSLREVVDKALVFCEHEFSESRVDVVSLVKDGLPPVRGIAGQLTQLFVNLFTNAAHAMDGRGGRLRIEAHIHAHSDEMVVEVSDDGIGIAPKDLEQIFEPFFTTKTDGRGTGLGLSIVREIVTSHGGSLRARSGHGQGSVFTVILPLAAVPSSLKPPPRSER